MSLRNVRLGLPGIHQQGNAQLAVAALDVLRGDPRFRRWFPRLDKKAITRGLKQVRSYTGLRGRLQRAGPGGRYILDVAHNPDGVRALVDTLRLTVRTPLAVVFGVMKDKDSRGMLEELKPVTGRLIAVAPRNARALSARRLLLAAKRLGFEAVFGGTVASGIRKAAKGRVLITGSHYVVGEACAALRIKKA